MLYQDKSPQSSRGKFQIKRVQGANPSTQTDGCITLDVQTFGSDVFVPSSENVTMIDTLSVIILLLPGSSLDHGKHHWWMSPYVEKLSK